ncbi:hypothetical protein J6590_068585 [Homalodisca vitripennis]|nr:hypothetical protein J6590_068585 [Homalodisca vitripennis]
MPLFQCFPDGDRNSTERQEQTNSSVHPQDRLLQDISGLIKGHGHLRKHLHRDPLCRMCGEQEETAKHVLFDCPAIAGSGIPSLVIWTRASWCASGVRKRPLRLKCMAVGRPIEGGEEEVVVPRGRPRHMIRPVDGLKFGERRS